MTEKDQNKAGNPGEKQESGLSRRDMCLARLETLLAEQHLPVEPEDDEECVPKEADEVNLEEAVEIAKLPPKPKAEPSAPPAESAPASIAAPASITAKNPRKAVSPVGVILKLGLLLVVLAAILVFGILAGRGHIWKTGLGQNLIVWIEQTAGLVPKAEKKDQDQDPKTEATPAEGEGATGEPDEITSESADVSGSEAGGKNDEMPVWNWPGWTPADMNEEETEINNGASAAPDSVGVGLAEVDGNAVDPNLIALADASGANSAEEVSLGDWPTAIEPDQTGLYIPPSDQEEPANIDYEAMPEPSGALEAAYAEAAPLPPAELSRGKFAVQVELAANENEAKNKRDILTRQGFPAYYTKDSKSGFSIRVGHYDTRQDADAAKVRLEDLGYEDPSVSSLTGARAGG